MRKVNIAALTLTATALAVVVVWALKPRPIEVEVAQVERGAFELTISDDGKTRVRDRYVLSAPLAGRIARVALKVGDHVKEGQTVAVLAPTAPALLDARTERELGERIGAVEAQQLRADAEAQKAEAQLAQVSADRERVRKLSYEGFVSAAALEQAELAVRIAEKASAAAKYSEHATRHELEQARAALARYRAESMGRPSSHESRWPIRSPVEGSVLKVVQENEGAVVLGAPLLEVADPHALEAVIDVLTQDAIAIKPGVLARIEVRTGASPFAGRVRHIEPAAFTKISALGVEEQRVNVVVDFLVPVEQIEAIGDGFRIDGHIVVYRNEEAIKIPVGALFRDGSDGWAVFVAQDDRAAKRAIKATRRNGIEAMVEEGLAPGETVVVYPPDRLESGSRISVRTTGRNRSR